MRLIDLGCGDGFHSSAFIKLGLETYGLDIAEDQLVKATALGIIATKGDLTEKLPDADAYFDIVYSGETIEHIVDIRNFLTEINRILRPGGLLILTTPNLAGLDDRLRLLFGKKVRHQDALCESHYLHVRVFTFSSLREVLEKDGFEIKYQASNKVRFGSIFGKDFDSYIVADFVPSIGATIIMGGIKKKDVNKLDFYEC